MARPKAKAPARQYHISGQSVVRIAGRDIYLGKLDSLESIARYVALVVVYQSNGLTIPEDFDPATLDERVALLFKLLQREVAKFSFVADHESECQTLLRIEFQEIPRP